MVLNVGTEFQLYMTHVEGEGPYLKMFGQTDKQRAIYIESLISSSKDRLEQGLGSTQPSSLHVGLLCIAKYRDGDYYRARIISLNNITSNLVSVYFIDYGNNDVVPVNSIRLLDLFPEIFRSTPPQATDFLLSSIIHPKGVWEDTMLTELRNLIYYQELPCVIECNICNKFFIKMQYNNFDLSTYLAERGYGVKISLQDQQYFLQKMLTGNKTLPEARMYVPPPVRTAMSNFTEENIAQLNHLVTSRNISQSPLEKRLVPELTPTSRAKLKNVAPPRRLNRSVDEYISSPQTATVTPEPVSPVVKNPSTYRSRLLELNSQHEVHVSFAKDGPKLFAIQLKSDERFLSNIVSQINSVPPQPLTEPPIIGSVCLGRFPEDNTLCRAVAMGTTDSHCKLFFVDFGVTELVPYADIFQISESDIMPHVFSLRFCLSGISSLQITEQIKGDFFQIVNNKVLTLKVVPPEGPPLIQYCELYLGNQSVKEMLLQKQNPCYKKIDPSTISGDHSVLVSYVDSCTKFFIQLSDNIDALNEIMEVVETHCKESQPLLYHQVKCGMSCCALFPDDRNWYRAIVTNIRKDKITVNYVDYGNEQEVTADLLRPIYPELTSMKSQAIHCTLKEYEDKPFDQNTSDNLEKLTLEKILTMHVHGIMEGGALLVDLLDESTTPSTHIARAIKECINNPVKPQEIQEDIQTCENDIQSSPPYANAEFEAQPKDTYDNKNSQDNFSERSYGSKDDSQRRKKPYQDRGDRSYPKSEYDSENKSNYGQKPFKKQQNQLKGNYTDRPDGNCHPSQKYKYNHDNRKSFQDRKLSGVGSQYHRERDSKSDRFYKAVITKEYDSSTHDFRGSRKPYGDRSDSGREKKFERGSWNNDKPSRDNNYSNKSYEPQPPKSLNNPVSLETPFERCHIQPGDVQDVRISWFINPHDFYVFILTNEFQFKDMMLNIPNLYTGIKPTNENVSIGSSVLARFPDDKVLYRAEVLDTQFGRYTVRFVDYGNKCVVESNDIWQLENEIMQLPVMALHCSLDGISPIKENWDVNTEIDDCFSQPIYKCTFVSTKPENVFNVTLLSEDGIDVGQNLIKKNLAKGSKIKCEIPVTKIKVFVTHIDSPGQFWLQLESDVEKIDALQESLQSADDFEDYTEREVGALCVAKYSADEQYYRTIILDADNDIITVRFIDYGNTDVLDNTPGILKKLPSEICEVEPYSMKCSVNATPTGTGQWTEQASVHFTELLGNTENAIDAAFVLKDTTTYVNLYVDESNITEKLVEAGYAVLSEKSEGDDMPTCFASHINSPSEFWIQLESSTHDLEAISEELTNAEEFPPLSEIAEEVICAAKFPEDDLWYRAQVIIHGSDGTEVLFMDYGNASLTTELKSLPDSLKNLPALSRKCALQKPSNIKSWSKEAELKFADLAADGATIFNVTFVASGDISIVDLYIDGKSVTDQLVSLCDSTLSSPTRLPLVGEDIVSQIYICHSNSPEDFWIHYASSNENLEIITDAMGNADRFSPLSNITEGALCASVFPEDGFYYRSKVLDHGENGTEVLHIDYGSSAISTQLKELPQYLLDIPALAKHCSLLIPRERSKINEMFHEKFAELSVDENQVFHIEIIDSNVDPMVVKLTVNGKNLNEYFGFSNELTAVENTLEADISSNIQKGDEEQINENFTSELNVECNQSEESQFVEKSIQQNIISEIVETSLVSDNNIDSTNLEDSKPTPNIDEKNDTSVITSTSTENQDVIPQIKNNTDLEIIHVTESNSKIVELEMSHSRETDIDVKSNELDDENMKIPNNENQDIKEDFVKTFELETSHSGVTDIDVKSNELDGESMEIPNNENQDIKEDFVETVELETSHSGVTDIVDIKSDELDTKNMKISNNVNQDIEEEFVESVELETSHSGETDIVDIKSIELDTKNMKISNNVNQDIEEEFVENVELETSHSGETDIVDVKSNELDTKNMEISNNENQDNEEDFVYDNSEEYSDVSNSVEQAENLESNIMEYLDDFKNSELKDDEKENGCSVNAISEETITIENKCEFIEDSEKEQHENFLKLTKAAEKDNVYDEDATTPLEVCKSDDVVLDKNEVSPVTNKHSKIDEAIDKNKDSDEIINKSSEELNKDEIETMTDNKQSESEKQSCDDVIETNDIKVLDSKTELQTEINSSSNQE